MAKDKTSYCCNECGAQAPKWSGQCGECGAWNSLEETVAVKVSSNPRFSGYAGDVFTNSQVQRLAEVGFTEELRISSGISELDRVLGGGIVHGSVTLIGGDPGIGKSTLLSQTLSALAQRVPTLYVTGEESKQQVSMRAHRLGLKAGDLRLLTETSVERMIAIAQKEQLKVMAVDSIQTVYTDALQSAPGSVAQVRESAAQLVRFAKQNQIALFLVGHVTKEGALAGPRVLEHMVDTVLYFEGDPDSPYRVIRAMKNRFGAVNELGVFAMTEQGLREVSNPSSIFLSRHEQPIPGSVILVTREGSRPMLAEVQALVDESHLANPRRVAIGLEQNRLAMLLAVLHRHGGIPMYDQDVFVNLVGGLRISETATDLPVLLSILSSYRNRPLAQGLVVFGEVGLAGEVRPVPNGLERLRECAKHGFSKALVPKANAPKAGALAGMQVVAIDRLGKAIDQAWES